MDIFSLIDTAISHGASDMHMTAGSSPTLRIDGTIEPMVTAALTNGDIETALQRTASVRERELFSHNHELDYGFDYSDRYRVRCNAAIQRGTVSLSLRIIPLDIPSIEALNLPAVCTELCLKPRGLIVVSGPTGSGKSTTLAAMLQYLNHNYYHRIVTIEDPVEYLFVPEKCTIIQRELGTDTSSFTVALKHVLRQDPDIIMVGEMRDYETAAAVLSLAETGHLVLTTGHAPSSHQAIERIIDLFPVHERSFAQNRLASLLVAVLCQSLVARNGSGRVPAVEVMLVNNAIATLIRDGKLHLLPNAVRTNREAGMQTLDQALLELHEKKLITGTTLLNACNDRSGITRSVVNINTSRSENHTEMPPWDTAFYSGYEETAINKTDE